MRIYFELVLTGLVESALPDYANSWRFSARGPPKINFDDEGAGAAQRHVIQGVGLD